MCASHFVLAECYRLRLSCSRGRGFEAFGRDKRGAPLGVTDGIFTYAVDRTLLAVLAVYADITFVIIQHFWSRNVRLEIGFDTGSVNC